MISTSNFIPIKRLKYFDHLSLKKYMIKGLRNRSWLFLKQSEKGLFQCSLALTKKGIIINNVNLFARLISIIIKLITPTILKVKILGLAERDRLLNYYKFKGIFKWAPRLEVWLKDEEYIFQLGFSVLKKKDFLLKTI